MFTSVWKERSGDVVVHFLNATACEPPKDALAPLEPPKPPFPALRSDISITVPFAFARASAVSPDFGGVRELEVRRNADGTRTVTLPKDLLKAYTLVRMNIK